MFDYMPDDTGDIDKYLKKNSSNINIAVDDVLIDNHDLNRAFNRVIGKLGRFYSIDRASLAILNSESSTFRVTHIKDKGSLKKGLALNFAASRTTMFQVLKQGYPVADNFPEQISNNIIEKRILLSSNACSVMMIPLIYDNLRIGVLNLTSIQPSAFGLYLDGIGEGAVAEFVHDLYQLLREASTKARV